MNRALHRLGAGVGTYGLTYLLVGLVTMPLFPRILQSSRWAAGESLPLWMAYTEVGRPFWKAVGWVLLGIHRIPLDVRYRPPEATLGRDVLLVAGYEWLYLVPAIACFLGGAATVALSADSSPIDLAVGSYLAVGYAGAAVLSTVLFRVTTTKASVRPLLLGHWNPAWLLLIVGYPLVFGTIGAFAAKSPLLQRIQVRNMDRGG